ncbi:type IV pilus biogenesis/stability protein PilW [Rhodoferax sp. 4810]|uniref:Type IV pilus biogenesis/stability protein PilW n=1 Tax=Thiospirillum jenense TaxID=1653858 RepID=A0A839HCS8_9GAMM|nr:type IV pilus biogenesis/stability protein PilW [Thiospirillum jenense]MBB1074334.1 type IV pilus biogenesis/stability protein PilW [Rhodoferax jenense]MBB1126461.1 type IV pilus biogenesis/stability protein PilW [Thiospirillum jenense]
MRITNMLATPFQSLPRGFAVQRRQLLWIAILGLGLVSCSVIPQSDSLKPTPTRENPADLYVNMAAVYLQRNQLDVALERANQAVKVDPNSARARYVLAIVYQKLGQEAPAEVQFRAAIERDENNADFRNAWGAILCNQKRYAEAQAQFERALKNPLYQTPEVVLWNAADCARRAGDRVKAETSLRAALTANPNFAPALLSMAEQMFEHGDAQAARFYMERYSRAGQVTARVLLLAWRIEMQLGNKREATALAQSLRRRFPDAPELMQLKRAK